MSSDIPVAVALKSPYKFQAMQYLGLDNALRVTTWLRTQGCTAAYLDEDIHISKGGWSHFVQKTDWIILGEVSIVVRSDKQFNENYLTLV